MYAVFYFMTIFKYRINFYETGWIIKTCDVNPQAALLIMWSLDTY
jgi:hypothetical protein